MWDPILRKEIDKCTLISSQVIPGRPAVHCILDPPRNAIGEAKYAAAQGNIAGLLANLPHAVIVLQYDFWLAYRRRDPLSIAGALRKFKEKPAVLSQENFDDHQIFQRMQADSVGHMTQVGPFLDSLLQARETVAAGCSPEFAAAWSDIESDGFDTEVGPRIRHLRPHIARARCSVPIEVALIEKMSDLGDRIDNNTVHWEHKMLTREIAARARAGAFSDRSALEIYLQRASPQPNDSGEHEETLAIGTALLGQPEVAVDAWIIREVIDAISDPMGDVLFSGIITRGDQRTPPRGDMIARVMELAPLLDIDVNRYTSLQVAMRYSHLDEQLRQHGKSATSSRVLEAFRRLEGDILDALATNDADLTLIELRPVLAVVRELRRFHMGYDDNSRAALATFSAMVVLDQLHDLDVSLPPAIESTAAEVDAWMREIHAFLDHNMLRGARLAKAVLHEIGTRQIDNVLLICDGYLHPTLAGAFGDDVSYSMLAPAFD